MTKFNFTVAACTMESNRQIVAILGYFDRSHGTELRLWDPHDGATDVHETDSTL